MKQLQRILDHIYETVLATTETSRAILLHPNSTYRSMTVARLVHQTDYNVFYYALGPDDISLSAFLQGITHDIANQKPLFGRHVNMLGGSDANDLNKLLKAFLRDIHELSDEFFFLILDEYDRSDEADDVQNFVEALIHHLPNHCRLIINSRTLPRLPWTGLLARGYVALLEDDTTIERDFYGLEASGDEHLEVYALGPGFVLRNNSPIDTWEGHLPRLLFFFALDRSVITRSEICAAFWPELNLEQAVNVFHVTKRRLHKALEMDVLTHDGGFYQLNPRLHVEFDVMYFVSDLIEGRKKSSPTRTDHWYNAIERYRGPFLQGNNEKWIIDRRQDYQAGYVESLTCLADYEVSCGRIEHALSLYHKAVTADATREDIHRIILTMYQQQGRGSEVVAHYRTMTDKLKEIGQKPSPELKQFVDGLLKQ